MQRESEKKINPKLKKAYDDRLRNFAITLQFLSPKRYSFVRRTFQTCLPHPWKIAKPYSSINAKLGFSLEIFWVLKDKCYNQVVCSLMFDRIAIRQHVDWDRKTLYEYIDLGCRNSDDGAPVASDVLVIHLVSINALWKIPLEISGELIYFFLKWTSSCLYNVQWYLFQFCYFHKIRM